MQDEFRVCLFQRLLETGMRRLAALRMRRTVPAGTFPAGTFPTGTFPTRTVPTGTAPRDSLNQTDDETQNGNDEGAASAVTADTFVLLLVTTYNDTLFHLYIRSHAG